LAFIHLSMAASALAAVVSMLTWERLFPGTGHHGWIGLAVGVTGITLMSITLKR
jgi:hypothetical protein